MGFWMLSTISTKFLPRGQRPLGPLRNLCLPLASQADVAHLLAKLRGVAQTLGVFVDEDQVAGLAYVSVRHFFCVGEESDDVANKFFEVRLASAASLAEGSPQIVHAPWDLSSGRRSHRISGGEAVDSGGAGHESGSLNRTTLQP